MEAEASSIHVYESELVHGLLQTADYYRTFLRTAPAAADGEEAERKIEVRLARQELLTGEDPPDYWVVLNEAVIRRVVGGAAARPGSNGSCQRLDGAHQTVGIAGRIAVWASAEAHCKVLTLMHDFLSADRGPDASG